MVIVHQVKFLGVLVDSDLQWSSHLNKITTKINQHTGILRYARHKLPLNTLRTIYLSLSQSALLYGIEVWEGAFPSHLGPLQIAQNKLLRAITFSSARTPVNKISSYLNILPLNREIEFRRLLAAYRILYGNKNNLQINVQHSHSYSTRFARHNIPIPEIRTVRYGQKSLKYLYLQAINRPSSRHASVFERWL